MDSSITLDVVTAVADAQDVDPEDLDWALEEYIDTDALEQLASHDNASWTLSFELPDHEVTVTDERVVLVDGTEPEPAETRVPECG